LSKPCDRQASEKAQVLQKRSASPSSAIGEARAGARVRRPPPAQIALE
jgi:hypothetical protein